MKTPTYAKMISNLERGAKNCLKCDDIDTQSIAFQYQSIQHALRMLKKVGVPERAFMFRLLTGKLPRR